MRGRITGATLLASATLAIFAVPAHATKAPTATTGAASKVTIPAVTLNATVNPNGSATTYKFEYGASEAYGSSIPASPKSIGSGTTALAASQTIGEIEAETVYHFRVVATNAFGTSYGKDETFAYFGDWTLESPPSPKAATVNYLSDVSCPSTSLCLAVGHSSANEGQSIAEVWSGGKWSLLNTGKGRSPVDVSCPTTTVCWAVGTQGSSSEVLVERYEYEESEEEEWGEWWGQPYTTHKPIVPSGGTNLRLNGISCTAASECIAVGSYEKEGKKRTLAERLTSSGWSVQTAPALTGAVLEDVSCTASNSCTAVGYQTISGYREPLAERWNGSEWTTVTVPAPELKEEEEWHLSELRTISCASGSSCVAVGLFENEEAERTPIARTYDGSKFSSSALPKLKAGSTLEGISCASSTSCLATGHNTTGGTALALAYNGKEWATQAALTPEGKTAWLSGVACPKALTCTAVGKATGGGETVTLAERISGSWTLESPPSPKAATVNYLSDVDCPSAGLCLAVGHSSANEGQSIGTVWSGGKWSLITTGKGRSPVDVSCPTTTVCWAVGTQGSSNEVLIERYEYEEWEEEEGGAWWGEPYTTHKPIVPSGGTNLRLNGISCTAASECTAVGYFSKEGKKQILAERLTSSGWSVQTTPALSGAGLEDVSCTASSSCTAVGYQQGSYDRKSFAVRFDGSEWSAVGVQAPPHASEAEEEEEWDYSWLTSVSCTSASDCLATGVYNNGEIEQFPLAHDFDGKEFSLTALPNLKAGSTLEAVSCASSVACLATGHSATGGAALALAYNGKGWATQAALTPAGKTAWLSGVACPEALMCMAVGKATGGGETVTLAERLERSPPTATTKAAVEIHPTGATLNATIDPNGHDTSYQFEYGTTTSYGASVPTEAKSLGSTTAISVGEPIAGLEEGTTYHYRVVAKSSNGTAVGDDETFTTKLRPESTITSPQPSYTAREDWPIEFESSESGSTFKCGFDEGKTPTKACTSPYVPPEKLEPGPHTFVVAAKDSEGLEDPTPATWTFDTAIYPEGSSNRKLISPDEGAKSASHFTLRSEWNLSETLHVSSVAYQLKAPSWDAFKSIPSQYLWDSEGDHPDWALEVKEGTTSSPLLFFDIKAYAEAEKWAPVVEGLQLRAVFNGGANLAGASQPVTVTYTRFAGGPGDAVEQIGPASVDLLTGAFTITRTDVSIPVPGSEANLEFTRTYNSAYGANEKTNSKTLGQMWQPSAPVEAEYEEEAWQKLLVRHEPEVPAVTDKECWDEEGNTVACGATCPPESCEEWEAEAAIPEQNWVEVLINDGAGISFERTGSGPTYTYVPPEEAKEFSLSKASGGFILADVNGTKTEFTQNGSTSEYVPSKVSYAGTSKQATLTYGIDEGKKRLLSAIGPAPAGVTCNPLEGEEEGKNYAPKTKGCRSLYLTYVNFAEEGGPKEGRLARITYYDSGGSGEGQIVSRYSYDTASGNLIKQWDPRVELVETYAYESTKDARLTRITPPGEKPWELDYYPAGAAGPYEAKLKSVSRASLLEEGPSTATTTIAYDVPIAGEAAPFDLGVGTTSEWGQSDYPVDATAVFPPTEVPSEKPGDYDEATIHYMDPSGNRVNTASPAPPGIEGDAITTSETDLHGNVVRELGAQNRLRALAAEDSVARSHELDTHSTYNADGTRMLESWGPLHEVRLQSGETVEARAHTTVEYDKDAPEPKEGETWPNLPTRETVGAAIPGVEGDEDVRVSVTVYDWSLRRPKEQITDPAGLNLVSKTAYNSAGQVTQVSQPSDTAGKTAGTTKTVYWTAATNSEESKCGNKPAWAGLPCLTRPAAEPSPAEGNPKLPWSRIVKYSALDQPEEIKEEVNASVKRSTTMTYDTAGRPISTHQTGEGAGIPPVETAYDEDTGRPYAQYFDCEGCDSQEIHTTFDTLGRPIEYLDADGSKSEVKYDLLGRPLLVSDGKGLQAFAYDEESGVATELTDSAAGVFKATYDADGKMTEQLLPNGLAQQIAYDEAGTAVGLAYEKTDCSSACTWLDFSREYSIGGQVLHQQSTLSAQDYSYDKAGRLTFVKDSEDGQCTTRSYAFDKNSNRTSMAAHAPGEGGGCGAGWMATQAYAYDSADRLIGEGITYDNLGRITTLPDLHPRPQESWEIDGETLAELELESESFASEGDLVLEFSFPAARLECQIYSEGEISGSEGIEESFTLYGCALYKIEGGEKGAKVSCGAIEASISDYKGTGTAGEMLIHIDFEKEFGCLWDMELPVSSFEHEFTDEEASKLPVQTKGKASFGAHQVQISADSTWYLTGKHAGHKLAFKAQGPITDEGPLSTSYYVNDLTHSQSQGGIANTYSLDASLRQRERVTTGGSEAGTQIYHYAGGSDSPAWVDEGEGSWTRNIAALGGSLGAIQTSDGDVTLQLADMHGDIIATADVDPEATELLETFEFDEYGNPKEESPPKYGWLGSHQRRTELPSGIIQMGVRSYVPAMGRFISVDPVLGGSANAYEYGRGDPVNNTDLTGEWVAPAFRILTKLASKVLKGGSKLKRAKRTARRIAASAAAGSAAAAQLVRWVGRAYKHWRNGGSVKISIHPPHHGFGPKVGPKAFRSHIQLNLWTKGVKDSGQVFRMPFGRSHGTSTNQGFSGAMSFGPGTPNGVIIGRTRFPE